MSEDTQELFQRLKEICVPLLGHSKISPGSIPVISSLLSRLLQILRESRSSLKPSLTSYVFFPLSTLLRRNDPSTIPDQVLEKILMSLSILCDRWWWEIDQVSWEQIFMLCSAIIGGIEVKAKGKDRADETKEAAAQCLWALVRVREPAEDPFDRGNNLTRASATREKFVAHARSETFIPILGQSLNSLLGTAASPHSGLCRISLDLTYVLVEYYLPDSFIPSVLPGVISSMCKVALGEREAKGWANGDTVAAALKIVGAVTVRAIGDDVCTREGAIRGISNLEDLMELTTETPDLHPPVKSRYSTPRTATWLQGTTSQLHIALKSLNPLVSHPTSSALLGLVSCSSFILSGTSLTLPQSQPLLLSYLLSISGSNFNFVSEAAKGHLLNLLSPDFTARHSLLQSLLQISRDHLTSLPRLLSSRSDSKVEHAAGIIESICSLTLADSSGAQGIHTIHSGVSALLGPRGGIERWGWSLLSVLEFSPPSVMVASASAAQLMLENGDDGAQLISFPELTLKAVTLRSAHNALERMFRFLGRAAGDESLYAIEWFIGIGKGSKRGRAVAAFWCAARLLEGAAGFSLENPFAPQYTNRSRKLEKFARGLARTVAELWEGDESTETIEPHKESLGDDNNDLPLIEHTSGLVNIRSGLINDHSPSSTDHSKSSAQPQLHRSLLLQLLAIISGILQARFAPLLLHTLYPVLHSLISTSSHLALTALAALHYITHAASFASPANLLLSNFDYALDAISRRLSRRWLDVDAAKVLVVLVRLVGRDVVQKAGDVVEECFDRLDEYHGYEVLVDGLVAVLTEVAGVVGSDEANRLEPASAAVAETRIHDDGLYLNSFLDWYPHRKDDALCEDAKEDFGPVPRRAWGDKSTDEQDDGASQQEKTEDTEPVATPAQLLTKQIVSRSMYFLTHGSPLIRARILNLLASSTPVLPASSLLPSIHQAWPFILNRFTDPEPFVVSAAAALVESLATHVGDFMSKRVWDDIWPRFRVLLGKLEAASTSSALSRTRETVGTVSAHTYSHRLYKAIIKTMTAGVSNVQIQDSIAWEVIMKFRCFIHSQVHEELQSCARDLYASLSLNNPDAVWLALYGTQGKIDSWTFFHEKKWDIECNVQSIFANKS